MPQLEQISTFAGQIFWLAVIFCGLLLVMLKVALPRIQGILQERRGRIDGDMAKAEAMRNEAVEVLQEYEEARARARDEARGLIFVEGSAPGPPRGIVEVTPGRKPPLGGYEPPAIPPPPEDAPDPIEAIGDEAAPEDDGETIGDGADEAAAEAIGDEEAVDEAGELTDAAEAETGDAPDGGADGDGAEERPGEAEGG